MHTHFLAIIKPPLSDAKWYYITQLEILIFKLTSTQLDRICDTRDFDCSFWVNLNFRFLEAGLWYGNLIHAEDEKTVRT